MRMTPMSVTGSVAPGTSSTFGDVPTWTATDRFQCCCKFPGGSDGRKQTWTGTPADGPFDLAGLGLRGDQLSAQPACHLA